jgi:hypothetical protein
MNNDKAKWAAEQLTKDQAIAFYHSDVWLDWDAERIVRFQLFQKKLCMPLGVFYKAITEVLGRPIYSHEFAFRDAIVEEYLGVRPMPSLQEVLSLAPAYKCIVVGMDDG